MTTSPPIPFTHLIEATVKSSLSLLISASSTARTMYRAAPYCIAGPAFMSAHKYLGHGLKVPPMFEKQEEDPILQRLLLSSRDMTIP
jgi:hypothetical protein